MNEPILQNQTRRKSHREITVLMCSIIIAFAYVVARIIFDADAHPDTFVDRLPLIFVYLFTVVTIYIASKYVQLKYIIKLSPAIYGIGALMSIISMASYSINKHFLLVGDLAVYSPACLYFVLFLIAYLTSKYKVYRPYYYILMIVACALLPAGISFTGINCFDASLVLVITFLLLSIKLYKDKRLPPKYLAMIFVGVLLFALFSGYLLRDYTSLKIKTVLLRGKKDPFGLGYYVVMLDKALDYARIMGKSKVGVAYNVCDIANTQLEPIVFQLGWFVALLVIILMAFIIKKLFTLSKISGNSYVKYFRYSTAVFFLVRTILGVFLFFFPVFSTVFPLMGPYSSVIVDMILLTSAVVIGDTKPGKLDDVDKIIDRYGGTWYYLEQTISKKLEPFVAFININDDTVPKSNKADYDEFQNFKNDIRQYENGYISEKEMNCKTAKIAANHIKLFDGLADDTNTRNKVFISYNHADTSYAELLSSKLEKLGLPAWYYERDGIGGEYMEQIVNGMKQSRVFVLLITSNSYNSSHVKNEVAIASYMANYGIIMMPILLENIALSNELCYMLIRQDIKIAIDPPPLKQLTEFAYDIKNKYYSKSVNDLDNVR